MRFTLNLAARWTDIHKAARSSVAINNDNMGDNNSNKNGELMLAQNKIWNTPSKLGYQFWYKIWTFLCSYPRQLTSTFFI